ncbi:SRPBCC family protein [Actinoplanes sp. NPDC024001]|uniref:SRPBCC family protein n=1 Tax=Actinoplanes sp. NPDC024001 TaxID=3154598 RepID=UPI0033C26AF1
MTSTPTGRLDGDRLILTRVFRAGIEDVWASITESDRTARWYGAWKGDAAPGSTIQVQMAYEEGAPWTDMRIDACEPPRRLALSSLDMPEEWHLELLLTHTDGRTELRFVHHLTPSDGLGEVGPGWEYYLDLLVVAREGGEQPSFDDYYPSMKAYYEGLAG